MPRDFNPQRSTHPVPIASLALMLTLLPCLPPSAFGAPRAQEPAATPVQTAAPHLTEEALAARLNEKVRVKLDAEKVVVDPLARAALAALTDRAARRVIQNGAGEKAVSDAETGVLFFVEGMISRAVRRAAAPGTATGQISGTYSGTVVLPDAIGDEGPATLTVTGNQFTLAQAEKQFQGRITVTSTEGYMAATLVFASLLDPASGSPLTASVRARVSDDELALTPVPGARNDLLFLPSAEPAAAAPRVTHAIFVQTRFSICPLYPIC